MSAHYNSPLLMLNKYNTIAENKQRALKRIEKQIMKKALESAKKSSFFNKKQEKLYNNYKSITSTYYFVYIKKILSTDKFGT